MSTQPIAVPSVAMQTSMYQIGHRTQDVTGGESKLPIKENYNESAELREAFHDFVGQTFFGQMLAAMRKTVDKPAYFHGGRTEEVFQKQLDQQLAEKLSDSTATSFIDPMFDLFTLQRQ